MALPLENLRVLDLSRLLPGAVCTLLLADQGAEVIKIEQPITGDYARWYVPRVDDYAAVFHAMNRNKYSLTLDLKQAEGQVILKQLAAGADVLIESFRPNVLPRLGLGYEVLKEINPRLVMCSLSGYGQTGPLADEASHDLNLAAISGLLMAGDAQVLPIQAQDFGGAMLAAFAISSALLQRERTGQGAYIDAALLDAGILFGLLMRAEAGMWGRPPRPMGEALSGGLACYRVYRTADHRPIALGALEPKFWQTFCTLAGRPDLANISYLDPDLQADLMAQMGALFASKSADEWENLLAGHETCVNLLLDIQQATQHPQVQARAAIYEAEGVIHTRSPFKMGDTMAERPPHRPAPALGADTDRLLMALGHSAEQVSAWRAAGVIG